jgi:two-component system, LytTR family, response regulator
MGENYNVLVVSQDESCITKISDYCKTLYSDKVDLLVESNPEKVRLELPMTDILFLDLDAPKSDTHCVCEMLNSYHKCIIFKGATKKIESCLVNHGHVCGFIQKPLKVELFARAMKRSFVALEGIVQIQKGFKEVEKVDFIAVPSVSKIDMLKVDKILYCEAEGRYTTFYLEDGKKIISSKNLGEYEKLLPNNLFFRIHHKYLVSLKKISSINKEENHYCEMSNNGFLPISKRRQGKFNRVLRLK